jgi:riboflavin kinase / FMN adenylyltransferase
MEIVRNAAFNSDLPRGGVVTIGNFDGVHRGHQMLIRDAVARARELGVPAVALTFEPHPERVLRPDSGLRLLATPGQRAQLLARCGIDTLVELAFDRRFAATSAEEFAREFLHRRLAPREVRLGSNFRFGARRMGDVALLERLGEQLSFAVVGVEPLLDGGEPISSTRVRREVAHGRVEEAAALLGRVVLVDGRVYSGERMGRRLGFPTINVGVDNELIPAHGVYVTGLQIPSFGKVFPSVTNIGVRPTIYENYHVTVESHVLDFIADVYREEVRVFFYRRLRDERVFPSSVELVTQIRKDVETARLYFLQHGLRDGELVLR